MARIVNEKEHAERRNTILDVAKRLVYTKGYEQMALQDIFDDLQMSKGAFYHYFRSKQTLLEALIERMLGEMEQSILPIVHDPTLSALEKIQCYLFTLIREKTAQKSFLLAVMRVWYSDENAIVRQKVRTTQVTRTAYHLAGTLRQGVQEGAFTISYPEQASEVLVSLIQDFTDTLSGLLLANKWDDNQMHHIEYTIAAYTEALERVLGAPKASLTLIDAETLSEWIISAREQEG